VERNKGKFKKGSAPGRPKGTKNKLTMSAKASVEDIFNKLGGVQGAYDHFSKPQNRSDFYTKVWIKILPKDVKIDANVTHSYDPATVQELGDLLREAIGEQPGAMDAASQSSNQDRPILPH
jgi:hypothetical protein